MAGSQLCSIFEKLNDQQFEIHIHMCTGDLLALKFFLPPAIVDRCSLDCALVNTLTLNVRHVNRVISEFLGPLLTLIYMGYFDNLFYMGGRAKKPPPPRSNSGI